MRVLRQTFLLFISLSICLAVSCAQANPHLEWPELSPILKQYNLAASRPLEHQEVADIEEADARLYNPLAGETIFLQASSPTIDSKELRPRYWLRVEVYPTFELAQKRASEYISVGAYDRIAQAYGKGTSHMASKFTVRLWAIARGKRVYALTTDTYLFTLIELPRKLKESISIVPET